MDSEIIQYVIVGVVLVLAAWYLLRLLRPSARRKKGCCGGCGRSDDTLTPRR